MDTASLVALAVACLSLLGTVAAAMAGRRSAQDSHAIEHRRLGLEVLDTTVQTQRAELDRLESRMETLSQRLDNAEEQTRQLRAELRAERAYTDLLLARWPRPPEPPPRPAY